jgi:hypothetical protein
MKKKPKKKEVRNECKVVLSPLKENNTNFDFYRFHDVGDIKHWK